MHQRLIRMGIGLLVRFKAINTMGMTKGVYRFKTHEQANAHADEALVRAIALNIAARRTTVLHK